MACLICSHPKRFRIETALRDKKPKSAVARDFGLVRSTLQLHIKEKHEEKNPAKEPTDPEPEPVDPFPNDYQIREMRVRSDRLKHVNRILMSRQYKGSETIAKLARLWRDIVGNDAEMHVAQLVAECARRHKLTRGPKDVQKEIAYIELSDLYNRCLDSGDYKTALSALQARNDLAGLKDDPSGIYKQIIAQFVQIVQVGAPHLEPQLREITARWEEGYVQAKAVLEGEIVPETKALSEPVVEAPPTPRSTNARIDPGFSDSVEPSSE